MKFIAYIFLFIYPCVVFSTEIITVKDADTKNNLVSASVYIKSLNKQSTTKEFRTKTNNDGQFSHDFSYPIFLKISYVGYYSYSDTLTSAVGPVLLCRNAILIDKVITTGQYTPKCTQKSVYPITLITQERIEMQSANNLRDLLQTESSIKVNQDGVLGSSLSINGISGQNVKILIDGVAVIGRLNGNIDLSQISLQNAERVEIIDGPMSSVYGSDALGGVINIITKNPKTEGISSEISSYYESVGHANIQGNLNYFAENKTKANISIGRNFFGGHAEKEYVRNFDWNPKIQYFTDLGVSKFFGNTEVKYNGKFFDEFILKRYEPDNNYTERVNDDEFKTFRLVNSLYLNSQLAEDHFVSITAAYSNYERKKNRFNVNRVNLNRDQTPNISDHDTTAFDSFTLRSTYSFDNSDSDIAFQTGFDMSIDKAEGKKIKEGNQKLSNYAVFGSVQYKPIEDIIFQPVVRFIHNSEYSAPVIPSLNIKYKMFEDFVVRFSYARGFRAPALKELYFNFMDVNHNIQGNPDLEAETSNSFNIALKYSFNNSRRLINLELKTFYNDIDNMIDLVQLDSNSIDRVNKNIGKYRTVGQNININIYSNNYSFKSGISYIGRYNRISEEHSASEFSWAPEISSNFTYHFKNYDTKFSIFYKYTGKLPRLVLDVDGNVKTNRIEDYHTLDLSLSKTFFDKMLSLTIGGKNLIDVRSLSNTGSQNSGGAHTSGSQVLVGWGRTFFANLKINIK